MNSTNPNLEHIILATSSIGLNKILSEKFRNLSYFEEEYPNIHPLIGLERSYGSSAGDAQQLLAEKDMLPRLIVLDADICPEPGRKGEKGVAASDLLEWIYKEKIQAPVIVVALDTPSERLQKLILRNQNISLWRAPVGEAEAIFPAMLSSLLPTSISVQRRITIDVGREAASYRIKVGDYEFSVGEFPYRSRAKLEGVIHRNEGFSPYRSNKNEPEDLWLRFVESEGAHLFEILFEETIGPSVLDALNKQTDEANNLELRFEIKANNFDYESLFKLPFELTHSYDMAKALCVSIPMARRVHKNNSTTRLVKDANRQTPIRILFVDARLGGHVSIKEERSGRPTRSQHFDHLRNTDRELKALHDIAEKAGPDKVSPPVVIDGATCCREGTELTDLLEEKLLSQEFDILHFSGHSTTLEQDGGTHLILPSNNGDAVALSVRAVADWAARGACKLVVLSSCRGASPLTAEQVMKSGGIEGVLGFRWDVDDEVCADYMRCFYQAHLKDRRSLPEAYQIACRSTRNSNHGTPVWASAVAVLQD